MTQEEHDVIDREIDRFKSLLARAADALDFDQDDLDYPRLIDELRKAAE